LGELFVRAYFLAPTGAGPSVTPVCGAVAGTGHNEGTSTVSIGGWGWGGVKQQDPIRRYRSVDRATGPHLHLWTQHP